MSNEQERERVSQPAGRLGELYRAGGVSEVYRGVRDFVLLDTGVPVHRLYPNGTLRAADAAVTIRTNSAEAVWRATGHGEQRVMDDFVARVREDDTVWDVGANIGSYALLAADAGADVVAFEPGPCARADLVRNAQANDSTDRINATPYALADWNGDGMLLPASKSGSRELAPDGDRGDTVPVRKGDAVDAPAPDVMKIDVEGAETRVLDGMTERLADCRACYLEIHAGVDRDAIESSLSAVGLSVTAAWGQSREETIVRAER